MGDDQPQYYWEIVERDGTVTKIPPKSVAVVQKRLGDGDPIHTRNRSIPARQVVSFRITAERYGDVPLIEAAAQAFKEPLEGADGSVQARWVKQTVPMERWQRFYSAIPSYKLLGEINGMVEIAFVKATHEIDVNKTPYLTAYEVSKVDNS